jgi:hypothetical protein
MKQTKKIIFLDLDGTLLNDKKEITPGNRQAIEQALNHGHIVTIATGRPLRSGEAVARELGLTMPGCYLICFNGAVIYDMNRQEIVAEETLDLDLVQLLFDEAEKDGIYIQTYDHEKVLTRRGAPQLQQYSAFTGQAYEINAEFPKGIQPPNKVLLSDLSLSGILNEFQKKMRYVEQEKRCYSAFSCSEYLEYCPLNASKGKAVEKLSAQLGVALEHTIAAGDEQNDLSMIRTAGIGVAMQNAKPEVKEIADYVTEHDNNHDGIAEIIYKFIL